MSVDLFYHQHIPPHPSMGTQVSWPANQLREITPSDLKLIDLRRQHFEERCTAFLHRKHMGYIYFYPDKNACDVVHHASMRKTPREAAPDEENHYIFGNIGIPPLFFFYPEEIPAEFQMDTLDCLYTGTNKLGDSFDYVAFANWIQSFFKKEEVPQPKRNGVGELDRQNIKRFWRLWIQATQEAEKIVAQGTPDRATFVVEERNRIFQEAHTWILLHETGHIMHHHSLSHPYLPKTDRFFAITALINVVIDGVLFHQRKQMPGTFLEVGTATALIFSSLFCFGKLYELKIKRKQERQADEYATAELRNVKGASHFFTSIQAHFKALREGRDQTMSTIWRWAIRLITYPNGNYVDPTHGTPSERLNHMNRYLAQI